MKALSIRQPWASLIACAEKTIELRAWTTRYRGPLLICASANEQSDGPKGVAVAIVDLVDVRPATPADATAARCQPCEDAFAWLLAHARPVDPFPVKGRLGLFDVDLPSVETHCEPATP